MQYKVKGTHVMTFSVSDKYPDGSVPYPGIKPSKVLLHTEPSKLSHGQTPAIQFFNELSSNSSVIAQNKSIPKLAIPELSTINLIDLLKEFQRTNSVSDLSVA